MEGILMDIDDMKWYVREEVHTKEAQEAILKRLEERMKIFEVRDRATLIPTVAFKFNAANKNEKWLLMTAGYGYSTEDQGEYIMVGPIEGGRGVMSTDPFKHKSMEMREAHLYILNHWTELDHGAVIDLEFLRGEKDKPAISDRINFLGRP